MIENKPSRTALGVAIQRASHQLLDKPLVLDDPYALKIVGKRVAYALHQNPKRWQRALFGVSLRALLVARSRVAEEALSKAVASGIRQYVVLGAGLDTFGLRNTNPDLRVFEVDFPSTQGWKRQQIKEAELAEPANVTFVPVDFERQQLGDELAKAGFDPTAGAFFSWLGVVPYLERDTIWKTLEWVASVAGPGGGIAFDYGVPIPKWNLIVRAIVWMLKRRVAKAGEPMRTSLDPNEVVTRLEQLGFRVDDQNREALNARFFDGRGDGLKLRGPNHIVVATSP